MFLFDRYFIVPRLTFADIVAHSGCSPSSSPPPPPPPPPPRPFLTPVYPPAFALAVVPRYPSGLEIRQNLMHELGVWGKQTSCFFQGVSGRNVFAENACFNGPRAMVNINDGMLGLSNITDNILFNGCRESDDHGNVNSWDRTPMLHLTQDNSGPATWSPGMSTVRLNVPTDGAGTRMPTGTRRVDRHNQSHAICATDTLVRTPRAKETCIQDRQTVVPIRTAPAHMKLSRRRPASPPYRMQADSCTGANVLPVST